MPINEPRGRISLLGLLDNLRQREDAVMSQHGPFPLNVTDYPEWMNRGGMAGYMNMPPWWEQAESDPEGFAHNFINMGGLGTIKSMNPEVMKRLHQGAQQGRNARKYVNSLIREEQIDPSMRNRAIQELDSIKQKRTKRSSARYGEDPLIAAARTRQAQLMAMAADKSIEAAPIAKSWKADFLDKIKRYNRAGINIEDEARKATLEAITREARKRGWKTGHTSKSGSRASSRYIDVPGRGRVRISDHELPQYGHRLDDQYRAGWVDEIIVDDWRSKTIDDYINLLGGVDAPTTINRPTPPISPTQAGRALDSELFERGIRGKVGYQGSPNAIHAEPGYPLGRLKDEYIGTGEGSAVYGRGHYIADRPGTAKTYSHNADRRYARLSGHMSPLDEYVDDIVQNGSAKTEMDVLKAVARKFGENIEFDDAIKSARDAFEFKGHLRKIGMNVTDDVLLHWDKPLSQQPKQLKAVTKYLDETKGDPDIIFQRLGITESSTGRELYESLGGIIGNQQAATEFAKTSGIKGIKYLDQGSRGAGQGSYNYVIFDPSNLHIMKVD